MTGTGAYGEVLAKSFGLSRAPSIHGGFLAKTEIAVTEIRDDRSRPGRNAPIAAEDAFLVCLLLRDFPRHRGWWEDGRKVASSDNAAGLTLIHDLKRDPRIDFEHPHHSIHFHISRRTLELIADDANARPIGDLRYAPGKGVDDPVLRGLGDALRPAFDRPDEVNRIFLDHLTMAAAVHVAQRFGGLQPSSRGSTGGLAAWQVRKAKDLLDGHLDGDLSLAEIARSCGLSAGHFSRAFKQSTGFAPHRWLLQRRVETAKRMLSGSDTPLGEVALACGFADQSHFTRIFSRVVGCSPGRWRHDLDPGA